MSGLQSPVHPLHLTVGECHPDKSQLLIADSRKLFSDSLNGTVKFVDAPAASILGWNHLTHVTLLAAQAHKPADSLLEGTIANLVSVLARFVVRLALEQRRQGLWRKTGSHRLQQVQREGVTAVWKVLVSLLGKPPLVGGSAWSGGDHCLLYTSDAADDC